MLIWKELNLGQSIRDHVSEEMTDKCMFSYEKYRRCKRLTAIREEGLWGIDTAQIAKNIWIWRGSNPHLHAGEAPTPPAISSGRPFEAGRRRLDRLDHIPFDWHPLQAGPFIQLQNPKVQNRETRYRLYRLRLWSFTHLLHNSRIQSSTQMTMW